MESNNLKFKEYHQLSDKESANVVGGWSPYSIAWSVAKGIAVSGYNHRKDIANGWKNGWNSIK